MNKFDFIILLSLLFTSLVIKEADAKDNMVTKLIKDILQQLPEEIIIPEVTLGNETNKFTDLKVQLEGFEYLVDGDKSFGFKMNLSLTRFSVVGNYDIKHFEIPELFPLFGKGEFLFETKAVSSYVYLKATPNFVTSKFDIEIPNIEIKGENSKIFFENLMNNKYLSDFINEIFTSMIPDLLKIVPEIVDKMHPIIEYFGNEIIRCIKEELVTGKLEECLRNITISSQVLNFHDNRLQLFPPQKF